LSADGDLVVVGANVRTLDESRLGATAFAVREGRFTYVGDDAGARSAAGRGAPVLDLGGRTVTPGLTDAHTHVAQWARTRDRLSLAHVTTMDDALARVREAHARLPAGAALLGEDVPPFGAFGPMPTAAMLEDAARGRVVLLRGRDLHAAWVSPAALAEAGVTRATPDPPGGRLGRDARGEPDGLVYENALRLFGRFAAADDSTALARALGELGALGLTGIHEFGDEAAHGEYLRLRDEGGLPQRVEFGFMRGGDGIPRPVEGRVRVFAFKGFVDGTLGSRTAWMLEPFAHGGGCGLATMTRAELDALIERALGAGVSVALHAIGDRATREALDGVERLAPADRARLRPRIEHAQLVHPDDLPRFARLGVVASMQPQHAVSDRALAQAAWGERDAQGGYAWRQLEAAGARLAFGSDVPIEPPDPRLGLWAAVTGGDARAAAPPARALSLERAFRAYTTGAAYAAGRERELGRIAPGYLADFVVWGDDPWAVPAERLRALSVESTWVEGVRIWPAV
jgi:predicted amidohydrolase YtcJ